MNLDLNAPNLFAFALALLATLYVSWQACLRSAFKSNVVLLEAFRIALVSLAGFTLFQPTFVAQSTPEGESIVKILVDKSGSMNTVDVMLDEKAASLQADDKATSDGGWSSRESAAFPLAKRERWTAEDSAHTVDLQPFAAEASNTPTDVPSTEGQAAVDSDAKTQVQPKATNIHQVLDAVVKNPSDIHSVVLVSDGDWNEGPSPTIAARKLGQLGIPVHTIGVGSPSPLPDLAITQFDLPTFAIAGKPLQIPFAVSSTLKTAVDVTATISLPDGSERRVELQVPAGGSTKSVVSWLPSRLGSQQITVRVPGHASERELANNQQTLPIDVRHEALRVLMIDSFPRWEYRYTRNALMRDPGVTVQTLLLHPDVPQLGGGPGYITEFPSDQELSKYDVVFLGDVGIAPDQLTEANGLALVRLVRGQAAGLIFLPGFRGFQSTLVDTELEDLLPVEMDWDQPKGIRSAQPGLFRLTEAGNSSLLTRLETEAEANRQRWNSLPGFYWHAAIERAKPNTRVLAVHGSKANRFGRLPLIVTRTYGTGKVLFVGSDSAWRWRRGVEDLYHYRFWSQMVRWMAYQRTMAAGESMRLIFTPDRPRAGDTVNLFVNAMNENGEPLQQGNISTQVVMPSGNTKTLNLSSDSDQGWGLFTSSFVADEGGLLKMSTYCRETDSELVTELNVRDVPREQTGKPARLDVLEEIASITGGTAIQISESQKLNRLLDDIRTLPPREPIKRNYPIWSHPLWGLMLISLLGCFWGIRKLQGFV